DLLQKDIGIALDLMQQHTLDLKILQGIQQQFNRIEKHRAQQLDFSAAVRALEQETQLLLQLGFVAQTYLYRLFQRYNFQMKKPTHKIYRTTNWPAYNRALMSRGNIAIWFDPATQWYAPSKGKQGRNQTYSDAAIQCCLMIKSLFRLSLRMVTGFVQSLIKLCGLNWTAPDYSTLCRRQKH